MARYLKPKRVSSREFLQRHAGKGGYACVKVFLDSVRICVVDEVVSDLDGGTASSTRLHENAFEEVREWCRENGILTINHPYVFFVTLPHTDSQRMLFKMRRL
jgi:hypothetical protein